MFEFRYFTDGPEIPARLQFRSEYIRAEYDMPQGRVIERAWTDWQDVPVVRSFAASEPRK